MNLCCFFSAKEEFYKLYFICFVLCTKTVLALVGKPVNEMKVGDILAETIFFSLTFCIATYALLMVSSHVANESEVRMQGLATAWSINHMLSFQGRLKSASHSDVRTKPLKINVSCLSPLCLLSVSPTFPQLASQTKQWNYRVFTSILKTTFLYSVVYILGNPQPHHRSCSLMQIFVDQRHHKRGVKESNLH